MNKYDGNYWGEEIDDPSDLNSLESFYEFVKQKKTRFLCKISQLKGLNRQNIRRNDFAKTVFKNVKEGKYGKEVAEEMKLHRGKINTNSTNVTRGKNSLSNSIKKNFAGLKKMEYQVPYFLFHFANTYFTEKARKALEKKL